MKTKRHKLGSRLLMILIICVLVAVTGLMITSVYTTRSLYHSNSTVQASQGTKALEY